MAQPVNPIDSDAVATGTPSLASRLNAEAFGTMVLVFVGVGTLLFATSFPGTTGAYLPVALAFGLVVVAGAFAFGHISGAYFNPAITIGAALAGRITWKDTISYIVAQLIGAIIGSGLLLAIAAGGKDGFLAKAQETGFGSTGYGERSPGGFDLLSVFLVELILTAIFVYVVLGATDRRASAALAPIAIGLTLTMILLIGLPVSGASVNPARSIATALFGGGVALSQLWVFIVAPIVGGIIAGLSYKPLFDRTKA
jgi:aquaporin Z